MDDKNPYLTPDQTTDNNALGESEIPLASRWARLGGILIDALIGIAVSLPVVYALGLWDKLTTQTINPLDVVLFTVIGFILYLAIHGYLLATRGQSIGKWLLNTRIVDKESNNILPLWKVMTLRVLPVSIVSQIPVLGGLLSLADGLFIFGKEKRCIHDYIAGTKVVKVMD